MAGELVAEDARNVADALAMLDEMTAKTGVTIDGGAWLMLNGNGIGPLYHLRRRGEEDQGERYQLGLGSH
jgi:hypothetical protein